MYGIYSWDLIDTTNDYFKAGAPPFNVSRTFSPTFDILSPNCTHYEDPLAPCVWDDKAQIVIYNESQSAWFMTVVMCREFVCIFVRVCAREKVCVCMGVGVDLCDSLCQCRCACVCAFVCGRETVCVQERMCL